MRAQRTAFILPPPPTLRPLSKVYTECIMALEMELDETKARSRDEVGMGAVVQSLQRSLASAESEAAEL